MTYFLGSIEEQKYTDIRTIMAKTYAIANQKGGVGKSTTCLCLGAALAEQGKEVLMIDLDPQAGLTISLGIDLDTLDNTIYAALIDRVPLSDTVIETKIEHLHLVPSKLDLAGAEVELLQEDDWDQTLKRVLNPIKRKHQYILIDCPPSLGVLSTNALVAAQRVIVPVQVEYLALKGLKQLNEIINKIKANRNPNLQIKILRTMHDRRTRHTTEAVEELKSIFGAQVYNSVINRTIKFADSSFHGEPILIYAKRSEAAIAYRKLAKEVLKDDQA